jgi:hypothetical protein
METRNIRQQRSTAEAVVVVIIAAILLLVVVPWADYRLAGGQNPFNIHFIWNSN